MPDGSTSSTRSTFRKQQYIGVEDAKSSTAKTPGPDRDKGTPSTEISPFVGEWGTRSKGGKRGDCQSLPGELWMRGAVATSWHRGRAETVEGTCSLAAFRARMKKDICWDPAAD